MLVHKEHTLPLSTFCLVLLGGPMVLLPYMGKNTSWKKRLVLIGLSLLPLITLILWKKNWMYFTILLLTYHFCFLVLFYHRYRFKRLKWATVNWQERLKASLSLFWLSLPIGFLVAGVERWMTDLFWSTYLEVNFSTAAIASEYLWNLGQFLLLALCISLYSGKLAISWSLEKKVGVILLAGFIALIFKELYYIMVVVPYRQMLIAELFPTWVYSLRKQLFLFLYLFAITLLTHQLLLLHELKKPLLLNMVRGVVALCLTIVGLAMLTGMPTYYSLLTGREFEKYGWTGPAVNWYSRTFKWIQSEELKSYLQYHVGLLARKNGNLESAREAFTKVLLKYNNIPEFVQKSKKFQRNLAAQNDGKSGHRKDRVVIPGVEARTEYKAAYCVPNSLGLVLNYWGDNVGAKAIGGAITKLNSGSFITDEAYYAESRDFNHFILPLRKREDIQLLIDHNIPVLAFIPGHVLAIFGYDDALETIITYDVATYEIWDERSWAEFSEEWNKTFNLLGVVVPDEKVAWLEEQFGEDLKRNNEQYLQYLIYLLSGEPGSQKIKNLNAAAGKELFFADWEYVHFTGKAKVSVANPISQDPVHNYLLKQGVEENAVLSYLYSLSQRGEYATMIAFLEKFRQKRPLSKEAVCLFAGAYLHMGDRETAEQILLGHEEFPNFEASIIEFLLRSPNVQSNPNTALQLSIQLLSQAPSHLNRGNSVKLAYAIWRAYQPFAKQNTMDSMKFIYHYLKNWDPMDETAIADFEQFFERVNFNSEESWEKEIWQERVHLFRANVLVSQYAY